MSGINEKRIVMRRWADFVLAHRKLVVISWVLIMVAGGSVSGLVTKRLSYDYSMPGQPSTDAAAKILKTFGSGGTSAPYVAAITLPAGQRAANSTGPVAAAFASIPRRVPGTRVVDQATTGDPAFITSDGRTAYALVFYRFNTHSASLPTASIRAALAAAAPPGSRSGVTGEDALAKGSGSKGPGIIAMTVAGGLGSLLVLGFVFASALALLPLIVALASILGSFLILFPLTRLGTFSALVEFLIALVGLGVAIDYSLLVVTRWREERHRGRDHQDAVVVAMQTAGRAVAFSGVTVAIGLIALVVLPVPFMRSAGIGGALIPLVSVAATLSLTPAILGGIGPHVDWPQARARRDFSRGWASWTTVIIRRRWLAAGAALSVLAALVVMFFGIRIGESSTDSLASAGPAYDTLQTLRSAGTPLGALTPIEILTSTHTARGVATSLAHIPGVARVDVPHDARSGLTDVIVIPQAETVDSASVGVVRRVRSAASRTAGVVGVAGVGATQIDFAHAVYGNFPLVLLLIAVLTYVLLVRAFRSLLLPLKAVVLNLVSLAATYGLLVLFWQHGLGSHAVFGIDKTGAVTFWVPVIVFAFLYGLSMDYEVFILARIRETYDEIGDTDQAVVHGMARTGRLVTCAALILFLGFAAMASGPGTDLKVMATGLGFGILLDATLIRSVLVPALVSLFGDWNWRLPGVVARMLRVHEAAGRVDQRAAAPAGAPSARV